MGKIEEHQSAVVSCALAAVALSHHDLESLLKAIEVADAMGPIMDPTLYRERGQALREDAELIRAALPLWRLAKAKAKAEGKPL